MKKKFVSAGLAAISAAGFGTTYAAEGGLSPKEWSVSASLRGFYDDNYSAINHKTGSFGVELSPTISLNVPLSKTDLGLRYNYGLYYYQDRQDTGLTPFDQSHQLEIWLDHAFNESCHVNLSDSFSIGQEPELLTPGVSATPFRLNGDNIANHANVTVSKEWSRLFSTSLHYANSFYEYDNSGTRVQTDPTLLVAPSYLGSVPGSQSGFRSLDMNRASLAGALNRVEQSIALNLEWTMRPETTVFIGYDFSMVNYTGGEPVAVFNYYDAALSPRSLVYQSNSRDSYTHSAYLGLTHQFTANIDASLRGGASYTESYNDPLQKTSSISPYADLSVSYTYTPGSYVQLGFTHTINSTDAVQLDNRGSITQYQESSCLYADINHRIGRNLLATVIGRFVSSTFHGGPNNNASDETYGLGINLNYKLNRYLSADAGWNFDLLQSVLYSGSRSYTRNRVYLGLGAHY